MNQEVDDLQPDISTLSKGEETEQLQSIGNISPFRTNWESTVFNMNTPPFTCNWTGCFNKTFTRKSDLK
jgi:hypothetical protein